MHNKRGKSVSHVFKLNSNKTKTSEIQLCEKQVKNAGA